MIASSPSESALVSSDFAVGTLSREEVEALRLFMSNLDTSTLTSHSYFPSYVHLLLYSVLVCSLLVNLVSGSMI